MKADRNLCQILMTLYTGFGTSFLEECLRLIRENKQAIIKIIKYFETGTLGREFLMINVQNLLSGCI